VRSRTPAEDRARELRERAERIFAHFDADCDGFLTEVEAMSLIKTSLREFKASWEAILDRTLDTLSVNYAAHLLVRSHSASTSRSSSSCSASSGRGSVSRTDSTHPTTAHNSPSVSTPRSLSRGSVRGSARGSIASIASAGSGSARPRPRSHVAAPDADADAHADAIRTAVGAHFAGVHAALLAATKTGALADCKASARRLLSALDLDSDGRLSRIEFAFGFEAALEELIMPVREIKAGTASLLRTLAAEDE
jgi:hypothetical protein